MDVGFTGAGHTGSGMVESLRRHAHRVSVFNRAPSKAQRLSDLGAHAVRSVAGAWRQA